jgi:hypothetical protein
VWAEFGLERSAAFTVDALSTTRPIEFEVHTPADAEGMFDVLTYEKGASVLRMLEQFLGEDTFRDGIRSYLTAHSYANTVTHDLWDALESVSDAPVGRIMDAWILAGGHPVLNVERNGAELALTQQRAVPLGAGEVEDRSWPIPARVAVGANGRRTVLEALVEPSPGNDGATALSLPSDVDWVMGNASGNGFWRTHHDGELVRRPADSRSISWSRSSATCWSTTPGPTCWPAESSSNAVLEVSEALPATTIRRCGGASARSSAACAGWSTRPISTSTEAGCAGCPPRRSPEPPNGPTATAPAAETCTPCCSASPG